MYYIYLDEAGTSAPEPVTVVATVVLNADRHWIKAKDELMSAINDHVPNSLRTGFIFHAKQVLSGYRNEDLDWPLDSRIELINRVVSIPRRLEAAISMCMVRRGSFKNTSYPKDLISLADFEHAVAFTHCVARANSCVRRYGEKHDIASLVIEDIPEKRKLFKGIWDMKTFTFDMQTHIKLTKAEKATGLIFQNNAGPIDRIIDQPIFYGKADAPLLQIADAIAFSFRRYFSDQKFGDVFVNAMLGYSLEPEDWSGPMSESTFNFDIKSRITSKIPLGWPGV